MICLCIHSIIKEKRKEKCIECRWLDAYSQNELNLLIMSLISEIGSTHKHICLDNNNFVYYVFVFPRIVYTTCSLKTIATNIWILFLFLINLTWTISKLNQLEFVESTSRMYISRNFNITLTSTIHWIFQC